MKVLLLNPPAARGVRMVREGRCMQREGAWTAVWAPITLVTMAAILEKEGFKVKVVDTIVEKIDFPGLKKIIANFQPDLIVVNTASGSIESDLSVASFAKKIDPKIKVCAFGIHVTALTEDCFKLEPPLDFIIRGEPEMTTLELAKNLGKEKHLSRIKGLSWRQDSKIIHNPDRPAIADLDSLPFPAWEYVNVDNYRMPFSGKPFLLVGLGRGCPYNCLFCADKTFYGQKLRLPSPGKVIGEIEGNLKKFKVNEFLFWTESFTLNREFALQVCQEIIKKKLKIRFVVNSRVDHVDRQLLKELKKAGCFMIGFGIESANKEILAAMRKGVTVSQIKKAVRLAKEAGLEVTGHFMLGFPGETQASIIKTINLACQLPFDFAQFYCTVPFPGSELYGLALKNNWLTTRDWSRFEQNFSVLNLPGLSASKVMELRRLAFRKFYFRPKIILKTLAQFKTPKVAIWFFKTAWNFWRWTK
ncbi:MAG: B12-binding domain-containing radical SAM protein [Patescibacteria group bacterium]